MVTVTKKILIKKSPDDVFKFVSNYCNDTKWRSGVVEMKQVPPQNSNVGTVTFEKMKFFGRKLITPAKVIEYKPSKKISFKTTGGKFKVNGFREVEPHGEMTSLTYSLTAELTGAYKYFKSFIKNSFNKRVEKDLFTLKRILEETI